MPTLTSNRAGDHWIRRLYLPSYQIGVVARYAHTTPQTVAYWHYRGGSLGPALPNRERRRPLSYLEMIEIAFVAVFREYGLSLQRIRRTREYVAQTFNSEYPFADYRFKTEGTHLLLDLQNTEPGFDFKGSILGDKGGQLGWDTLLADKFYEFDYEAIPVGRNGDNPVLAVTWHVAGRDSLVLIDPRVAFGAPMVRGIPTWAVKGRDAAGETREDIQEDFGLTADEITHALAFEGGKVAA